MACPNPRDLPRSWILTICSLVLSFAGYAFWVTSEAVSSWEDQRCPTPEMGDRYLPTRTYLITSVFLLPLAIRLTFYVGANLTRKSKFVTGLAVFVDMIVCGMVIWGLYVYVKDPCKMPLLFVTLSIWAACIFITIAVATGWSRLLRKLERRKKRREQRRRRGHRGSKWHELGPLDSADDPRSGSLSAPSFNNWVGSSGTSQDGPGSSDRAQDTSSAAAAAYLRLLSLHAGLPPPPSASSVVSSSPFALAFREETTATSGNPPHSPPAFGSRFVSSAQTEQEG